MFIGTAMYGTTAVAAGAPHVLVADPYRLLFDHIGAGVAHCRLVVERDQVVAVEVLDSNRAFDPVRGTLPRLLGMLSRVRAVGRPETLRLRGDGALLSASAYPVGGSQVEGVLVVIEDVTACEQLEQRVRDAQVRFERVFHGNAAAMVIAHRSDLRIIDVNPRWLQLFSATRAEVIGRTSVELGLITPTNAATRVAEHRQFASGYDVELELTTRAGRRLTVLASARPIEIAEGSCTLTTLIDITGRKHAEEAFAVAFSASPAGLMLVDAGSDTVIAVNNRLLEMTRDRREDLVGRPMSELGLVISPSREALMAEIEQSGRLESVEVELACKDGPSVWTLASTELVTLHDKVHRLSVFTDISSRKQFERRLLTQHMVGGCLAETSDLDAGIPRVLEALCRGEGLGWGAVWLRSDEDAAPRCCGSWCDPSFAPDLAAVVRELGNLPGGLPGRVLATGIAEKIVIDPASCASAAVVVATGMRHAVAFPVLRGNVVLGVVVVTARSGVETLDAAERGLFDSIGRLLGLFVERTRAQAALRDLNMDLERRVLERTRALETSNRDLDAFSSSVSHDLRAPLRAIAGFSEILLDDFAAELPAEAKDLLARIRASGGRLHHLVEGLLEFARLGCGELRRSHVDLDLLVRSVLDELLASRQLDERIEVQVRPLGTCRADPALLRTVWMNLIDNALKYSQNRDRIVIAIGRETRDSEVVYYVRDNGIGFDMAHADRLFGVFQRLHSARDFEGTGIGLANVRRIVESHHGRVNATSELGHGSQFEFTLGMEIT